jgi:hypothetical protein
VKHSGLQWGSWIGSIVVFLVSYWAGRLFGATHDSAMHGSLLWMTIQAHANGWSWERTR